MKKILMRSAMPLGEGESISEILINNYIADNTGNLLYQESVERAVMTEDTVITTMKIADSYTQKQIDEINASYDMFLIPLANAFRTSFITELEKLTALVERMTIPCIVIGVGVQMGAYSDCWERPFDEAVLGFMKAVLDKSSSVGIRGERTAEYLTRKGFIPEKDFTVIGCPSLYMYGDNLPRPKLTDLTPESKVSVNFKEELPKKVYSFLRKEATLFKNYTFITQVTREIKSLYVGCRFPIEELRVKPPKDYPMHLTNPLMSEGRMIGFVDTASWISYLRGRDFNFGSRIHGNIASILAGTPCYIFASDSRVKELAEYHNIPHINKNDLKEDTNIFDLYEKADYGSLFKGHGDRLVHYLDFLDENKVEHLTRDELNTAEVPFDQIKKQTTPKGMIRSFPTVSLEEQEYRIQEYLDVMEKENKKRERRLTEQRNILKSKLESSKSKNAMLEKELAEIKSSKFYKMKVKYDNIKKR